ncbi:MAG TPA: phage major tail protein, TP901-1 family [Parvularculaceae bacterium]|nr:phage major tail protein, TP901-1 family [Parvularculaceae bacterium]HNS87557.1 phage major tail protein, TP901-1 family [Parvularculaceae bacterium]
MTAQRGKDMLVKIGDGGGPESFSTVAGLRTKTISLNAREVDATHAESNGWRELLGAAGVRQCSVSGAGVFLNDAAADAIRATFFAGDIRNFQLVIPGMGTFEGPFLIANLDYAGDHDGEATVSIALASAGAVAFTAAP